MKCKRCSIEHSGTFGSGVFCSRACANERVYSSSEKELVYGKISKALTGKSIKKNGIAPNKKERITFTSTCLGCSNNFSQEIVDSPGGRR